MLQHNSTRIMTEVQQRAAAKQFAADWAEKGYEKGETARFWIDLLQNVYGIENPTKYIIFEEQIKDINTNFIDARIPSSRVLIEQKSFDKNLRAPIKQSDGSLLSPFQQAKRYVANMPLSEHPKWIVTCNFRSFLIYDMEQPNGEPQEVLLQNLEKEYYRLGFLVNSQDEHLQREMEISIKAGNMVGVIYDKLHAQYLNPNSPETLKSLNMLCVRLVFCLYAEDAGIFGHKSMFGDFLKGIEAKNIRKALIELFRVLDLNEEKRKTDEDYIYADESLRAFPYVNGGLFTQEDKSIPQFTDEIKGILINKASGNFDWSEISPTIFGAVFESTLNPETRRGGGMHYTSIENIHKVIDPLFMDGLNAEYDKIVAIGSEKKRKEAAIAFQKKLGGLNFLDPACGSGNFLTETYLSLRRLENKCLRLRFKESVLDVFEDTIFVNIHQFYGIEINDFATVVAKTALWIAESQMMKETAEILHRNLDFLPLKSYANVVEGNALQLDWRYLFLPTAPNRTVIYADETRLMDVGLAVVSDPIVHYGNIDLYTKTIVQPKDEPQKLKPNHYDYIMGNPPFVGARLMSEEQKNTLVEVFGKDWKNVGNLDFVSAWYKKAFELVKGTNTKCALVSTNSITQGEQVPNLWKPLFEQGLQIDFAYRTFRWDSESSSKAHVHCVIVGFSDKNSEQKEKFIFDESGIKLNAKNVNPYLIDASSTFIESRQHPICNIPEIGIGNKPIDGGNYLFSREEMEVFIKKQPEAEMYFKPWYGSDEFINRRPRYCLWLGNCSPNELRKMKHCLERVRNVRNLRLASKSEGTRKIADKPTRFHVENMPKTTYLLIPRVSSEKRRYIPIGFMQPTELTSDSCHLIPNATLYEFGILTSNVHMAWMRAVCGRLKSDYRYSKDIVYNNFPWCTPTAEQKAQIEATAQAILDARAKYPHSSLADLYDETTMPPELRKAHQANDKAVMQAYSFPIKLTESECVAELFNMYEKLSQ